MDNEKKILMLQISGTCMYGPGSQQVANQWNSAMTTGL
jgi:hypothetical protein